MRVEGLAICDKSIWRSQNAGSTDESSEKGEELKLKSIHLCEWRFYMLHRTAQQGRATGRRGKRQARGRSQPSHDPEALRGRPLAVGLPYDPTKEGQDETR